VSLLLLTYTAGMATSSLSLLPAGIGLIDGATVLAFAAGLIPVATALPVVLLYRLIRVGAEVAAGWCIAALLRRRRAVTPRRRCTEARTGRATGPGHGCRA